MIPARMDHCATLMMSSAGRPSRLAWRWATQSPTTIEVAMRIPYQRTGNGPNPKIAGIWNAMAPGDANMTDYDKPWEAVSPRNATASAREPQGRNADQPARPREQRQDVFGTVVERVGRIVFPVDDATVATPIGLDAATDEVHRMQPNERPLPRLQNDGPSARRAGPRLREQAA